MATTVGQIASLNPATEEVLATFDPYTPDEIEEAVAEAQASFLDWRERTIAQREPFIRKLPPLPRERPDRYGRVTTLGRGKPISEAKAEIEKGAGGGDPSAANP